MKRGSTITLADKLWVDMHTLSYFTGKMEKGHCYEKGGHLPFQNHSKVPHDKLFAIDKAMGR